VRAIIVSAGQGRRLFPITRELPKCLVPVDGSRPVLAVQLETLAAAGVAEAVIMAGYGVEKVERFAAAHGIPGIAVRVRYNPFFDQADNLITAWLASQDLAGECVLLNGDTLFEREVATRLFASPPAPLTIVVNQKPAYDADDMKVTLAGGEVRAIGKDLAPEESHGEAIGMTLMRGEGAAAMRDALERLVRRYATQRVHYTTAIGELARRGMVRACAMNPLWWAEIDSLSDLETARKGLAALK
jgi:choline kinase